MNCILKFVCILESFGECSGLNVNDEKTEILAMGNNFLQKVSKSTEMERPLPFRKNTNS